MMGEVQICVSYARNLDQNGRFSWFALINHCGKIKTRKKACQYSKKE
jgi:hypothetical protein